jgi:hypothetical protein
MSLKNQAFHAPVPISFLMMYNMVMNLNTSRCVVKPKEAASSIPGLIHCEGLRSEEGE